MTEHLEAQPLSDLRVIDLTHGIAGPYCTKLLADFGADVIKVERPGSGDYARAEGPFPQDVPHPEKSGLFLHLNTNKRSFILDLKTTQAVEVVKELVKSADVLVENFRPGVMADLGLDYDTLSKINPDLIMTSISNFGQTGPYRDYLASELTLFGMGGRMHASGFPERYPLMLGGKHVQYQAGNNAAMATMFALHGRNYQGMGGQFVDISIFETQMASINGRMVGLLQYQYNGEIGQRLGGVRIGYPAGIYPCADGYVNITAGAMFWPRTVALLGMPELDGSKFAPPMGQLDLDAKQEFEETIWLPWTLSRTKLEVVAECQKFEIPSAGINNIDDVVDHLPQLQERGYFVEIDHPVAGKFRYTGRPIVTDGRWWQIRRPAPLLGQHNDEVAAEVEKSRASASPAPAAAPSERKAKLPLEGIRIADMTVVLAGPYSTMFLGDMGAEVIRVESVNVKPIGSRGPARATKEEEAKRAISTYPDRDPGPRPWNRSANFNAHNRSKYSMTADLHTPEGKDIMRRLIEISDLFMENNAMGSMERLGLTYDVVSQWNPRIIMISTTGFGRTGPWAGYRGFGMQFEAAYGHASVMGYPDMDAEGVPAAVPSDASTGVTMAIAALMALRHREKTGKGMYIDISLGENFMPHLGELIMDYTINGRVASTLGNRDYKLVQGAYRCAGDDEWIAITIGKIEEWQTLCKLMGRNELVEDDRFSDMEKLRANHNDVDRAISAWTVDKDPIQLFHLLQKESITAGPIMHEIHAFADPHVKEREFFQEVTAPELGTHLNPTTTFKLSKVPFPKLKPPVRLGEDNDYVYREVLKISEEEYDKLKALGQIGMDYAPHVT